MMMNMLLAGGVPLLTDGIRTADSSNPRGYFEYERVKALEHHTDLSWLPEARGKAIKVISYLLTWLPETYDYRVIFMERSLDEIIASQDKMLDRLHEEGRTTADASTRDVYVKHLNHVARLLDKRQCFRSLRVSYRHVLESPENEARRISAFLDRVLDIERIASVVDQRLYRIRH